MSGGMRDGVTMGGGGGLSLQPDDGSENLKKCNNKKKDSIQDNTNFKMCPCR